MSLVLAVFYGVCFVLAAGNYFFRLRKLNQLKKRIGPIQDRWSSRFSLAFPMSWVRWGGVLAYFLWCIYQVAREPRANSGHLSLMLLLILLSFSPGGNVYLGTKGVLYGMKVILWTDSPKREIVFIRKKRYLEIEASSPVAIHTKSVRIRLPGSANISF